MGLQIKIPNATFPSTKPILQPIDDIGSSGSMVLFDVSNPDQNFTPLTSSNATGQLTNLFATNCATVISSTPSACYLQQQTSLAQASGIDWELSGKGGLHVMAPQTGQTGANLYRIYNSAAHPIQDYYFAQRSSRAFYFSIWMRVTRAGISTDNAAPQSFAHHAINTSNFIHHNQGTSSSTAGASQSLRVPSNFTVFNAALEDQAALVMWENTGASGTPTESNLNYALGGNGDAWGGFNVNKAPSYIFYRMYMEDLTTSGRTFAEVAAIDQALHTAAFSEGGAFYGDTWTDPATSDF